jgi:hypothetical protein
MRTIIRIPAVGLAGALVWADAANAAPLSIGGVFQNAALPVKAIVLGLILSTIAAVVVCGMKLGSGARLSGGSAFLSGLRLGGPLAGLVGAAYGGLLISVAVANSAAPAPANVLAQGIAEIMMLVLLGFVSGAVAVIAHWAVEARIDRTVLGA